MPIHRERYRRRESGVDLRGAAWAVIAANGLRSLARKRAFLFLMILAWIPVIVRGVQIWAAANVPGMSQIGMLAVTPQMFRDFLNQQEPLVFFITVYAGSGLIADDIRANALQLYLSRPITRTQYIAGKAAILMAALAAVTFVPAMLLLLLVPAFAGSLTFLSQNLLLIPSILGVLGGSDHAVCVSHPRAVVAEQEPLVRGHSVRGAGVLYARRVRGAGRGTSRFRVFVGVDLCECPPGRRRPVPHAAPARHASAHLCRHHRAHHRRIGVRPPPANSRHRGGHMITDADRAEGRGQREVVRAENLSKWYGQVIGLNDITITIGGGVTGLLGPNGAGKSTLLKLITGQLKPSKGTVKILGEPVWGNPGIFLRMGVCPEQDAFYDRMTGHEWVTALLRLHGFSDRAAADSAMAALEQVDLKDAANKRIGAYSKGMRQRVKLAQALAHEPELLVLDEPLSGMDPLARRKTIRLLRSWAAQGRNVIVSSHVLHEVEALTSDILLMHHGRVLAEGNVHQIRDLIDEHPHTVCLRSRHPRALATMLVANEDVLSVRFEEDAVFVQTAKPDAFYARITEMAANDSDGDIYEVTSPDDNLQAVFEYLVKS